MTKVLDLKLLDEPQVCKWDLREPVAPQPFGPGSGTCFMQTQDRVSWDSAQIEGARHADVYTQIATCMREKLF